MKLKDRIKNTIIEKKEKISKRNYNFLLLITLFVGVVLIVATYAWFYASLNVKINFFKLTTSDESGLFISLDGVEYGSTVEISKDNLIKNLNNYPTHTNQWPSGGLYPVSTNGIPNSNTYKFNVFNGGRVGYIFDGVNQKRYLTTILAKEDVASQKSTFIAFDVFLKNVSGSPFNDNLFLVQGTSVYFIDNEKAKKSDNNEGLINSTRIGMVKIGSVPLKADLNTVQNIQCNNNCQMFIYEPNSMKHSDKSIEDAKKHGVTLVNGVYTPTYAAIKEGKDLEMANGQTGSNIPLDTEHFAFQVTKKDFTDSIFQLPSGVTKARIYVWLEGQDIDSLETLSEGSDIGIAINFYKDLAGYY